ncbi:phosphonate C-P lyase system protein PhnH [Brevibacterium daeguense]|uniref:Phosphonate C-P lyase system protein PhnH n=1 Tax=Brevibacterium daeguense TaxID=909936 RepID=A0ABP8EGG5_9MICO|nr:phosphonate C-P lyase system protein PhnH [Brevibacterium daeguense]
MTTTAAAPHPTRTRQNLAVLSPATAQRIFRQCLEALARPGASYALSTPEALAAAVAGRPAVVAPALALADLMTPLAPVPTGAQLDRTGATAQQLVTEIVRLTGAPRGTLPEARLALSLSEPDPASIRQLGVGTAFAPHHGALLFQHVDALGEGSAAGGAAIRLRLSGPGVDGTAEITVDGVGSDFFAARETLVANFPTGIDVLFVSPEGTVLGLPRTTKVEVL